MTTDAHPITPWLTPPRRAWLYRIVVAVQALLVAYGIISGDEAAAWLAVATAVLGTTTAALHTPTQ